MKILKVAVMISASTFATSVVGQQFTAPSRDALMMEINNELYNTYLPRYQVNYVSSDTVAQCKGIADGVNSFINGKLSKNSKLMQQGSEQVSRVVMMPEFLKNPIQSHNNGDYKSVLRYDAADNLADEMENVRMKNIARWQDEYRYMGDIVSGRAANGIALSLTQGLAATGRQLVRHCEDFVR